MDAKRTVGKMTVRQRDILTRMIAWGQANLDEDLTEVVVSARYARSIGDGGVRYKVFVRSLCQGKLREWMVRGFMKPTPAWAFAILLAQGISNRDAKPKGIEK